jgi:hypothetical protein
MAICGCGLPAHCCQPAVAGDVIYADLRGELSTHLAPQALLRVLLCVSCCYKLSPFQAHWGRWHCTRFLRPACLFTVHMGSGSFPPLLWSFPPTAAFTSFPAPDCWACAAAPTFSGPACLFTFPRGIPLLPLWSSGCPTLFAICLYCSYCLLLSISFFPGWGPVCPGGYADLAQGCL